jgi:hypothetical protein
MDSSAGNLRDVPGRPIPGLADELAPRANLPDPQRAADLLEAVRAWMESKDVSVETTTLLGCVA